MWWTKAPHIILYVQIQRKKTSAVTKSDQDAPALVAWTLMSPFPIMLPRRRSTGRRASAGETSTTVTTRTASTWSARSPRHCSTYWMRSASESFGLFGLSCSTWFVSLATHLSLVSNSAHKCNVTGVIPTGGGAPTQADLISSTYRPSW